jgi:hypothetical protein
LASSLRIKISKPETKTANLPKNYLGGVGRGRGAGRDLGVGVGLRLAVGVAAGVGVAVGVAVGVEVGVAVAVGMGVGVGPDWHSIARTSPLLVGNARDTPRSWCRA